MVGRGLLSACAVLIAAAPAGAAAPVPAFRSCPQLVRYARAHAGATPSPGVQPATGPQTVAGAEQPAGAPSAASQTNVQEPGVDEPDTVKVVGGRLLAVAGDTLYAIDVDGPAPRIAGSVALPAGGGHELLVHGDHALVISRSLPHVIPLPQPLPAASRAVSAPPRAVPPARGILPVPEPHTVLSDVDVSAPGALRVTRTLTVPGTEVGARLTGATARVVVSSPPRVIAMPQLRGRAAGWVPRATLRRGLGRARRTVTRALVGCRSVRRPPVFSGTGLLTVLTVDLDRGLPAVDADALMTDAQTVYASPGSLYVATRRYGAQAASATTIDRFDTTAPDRTEYRATGSVPGHLIGQFAMSEDAGVLRVASTTEALAAAGAAGESFVTTLAERAGRLERLGQVGGLGRGERIQAVRFAGPVGYVVTFRRTDPLYTVDLSRPASPRVAGELALQGYSAYLHPISDRLLLGVGQDATAGGVLQGAQLSLFDVSDPAHPALLVRRALGAGSSTQTEYDHHAFLWWPATRLAVLPVSAPGFTGAIGFRVGADSIDEVGRVAQAGARPQRAVVIGDRLLTVSEAGVQSSVLETLADAGWLAFPAAPAPPGPVRPAAG